MEDEDELKDYCDEIKEIKVKVEPIECDVNIDDKKLVLDAVQGRNVKLEELADKKHVQDHETLDAEDCIVSCKVDVEETCVYVHEFNQDYNTKHDALIVTENIKGVTANGDILHRCPKCKYTSNSRFNYKRHVQRHNHINRFVCTICHRRFSVKWNLQQHMFTHSGQEAFKCKQYINRRMREKHMETGEKRYKCPKCEYRTNYKCTLKRHVILHDDTRRYECQICKRQFKRAGSLKVHRFVHDEGKRYQCADCDYKTNIKGELSKHMNHKHLRKLDVLVVAENIKDVTANGGISYNRRRCTYTSNSRLVRLHRHDRIEKFVCTICQRGFCYKARLELHMVTHSVKKVFECSLCDYRAMTKQYVNRHILNKHPETGEKLYNCPKCEYKTNDKYSFKLHEVVHDDTRPYECEICYKQFKRAGSLKSHRFVHDEEKRYQCAHCDYETKTKRLLVVHLNNEHMVTGERRYKCSKCEYKINSKHGLKQHEFVHDDARLYECEICNKQFKRPADLKVHGIVHDVKTQLVMHLNDKHLGLKTNEDECPLKFKKRLQKAFEQRLRRVHVP